MRAVKSRSLGLFGLVALIGGVAGGIGIERLYLDHGPDDGAAASKADTGERKILYWVAPMDANYRRDGPGKSPMGMDLIPVYQGDEPGAAGDDDVVTLSPSIVHNLGVRTAVAERATFQPAIETFGVVAYDETRTSHVHVRAEGWIERLNVRSVGEPIENGQVLFEVFSPQLAIAAWEYVRELQQGDGRTLSGGPRKLLSLGADPRQVEEIRRTREVPERMKVYAPRSGVAVALNVAEGMFVEPDMTTISITDPSIVWLIADVFESQAAFVHQGMGADIRVAGIPGRVWSGVVEYVYPDLRPQTRTVQLRLRLDNPGLALKPNMYASVSLATEARENVLAVPQGAVIRTGRSDRIVKALGDGRFKAVPVRVGQAVGDRFEILEGVSEGERVVVSAQFLIDSESNLAAGFRQMESVVGEDAQKGPQPAPAMPNSGDGPEAWAIATINGPGESAGQVNVTHEPIPALGWPAMTMDLGVDDAVAPEMLAPGRRLRIGLAKGDDGLYRIVAADPDAGGT